MNTCRACERPIPARLCFCAGCMKQLTPGERLWLLSTRAPEEREKLAQVAATRLRGSPAPRRASIPPSPSDAAAAFREARRILAPLLGKEKP